MLFVTYGAVGKSSFLFLMGSDILKGIDLISWYAGSTIHNTLEEEDEGLALKVGVSNVHSRKSVVGNPPVEWHADMRYFSVVGILVFYSPTVDRN